MTNRTFEAKQSRDELIVAVIFFSMLAAMPFVFGYLMGAN